MDKRSNIGTRDFLTSHFLLTWSLPCNTFLLSFKEYFYSVYFVSCSMQTILHFRQRLQRDFLKAALLKVSSRNEVYTTLSDSTISCREKVFVATNPTEKSSSFENVLCVLRLASSFWNYIGSLITWSIFLVAFRVHLSKHI